MRQNGSVGGAAPPAPETNQMILRKLLQSLSGDDIQKIPQVRSVEGVPLTEGGML